jgi:hypothetical protein
MNFFWSIIIATHVISVIFLGLSLLRYFAYKKRNTIIDTRFTMLFGFIKLNHVIVTYVGFVLAYTIAAILFILYLASL